MTWFLAGSAALTVGTTYLSANSAAQQGAKQAGAQSRAEGEAITKERLNTTIRNSYNTAFAQMQLGLKKKQLAEQGAGISAAGLAAKGEATLATASTGSIGASTAAVLSDIEMKKQAAIDMTTDAFENAVENYNNDLNMMVLNTDQSAPTPRKVEYLGPSQGEMLGGALLAGGMQFASSYAMRKMSLGAGPSSQPMAASNVSTLNSMSFGYNPSPGIALGNTSNFFSSSF
jgi:hypothetical protein